mgnify:CR=1 FL=1
MYALMVATRADLSYVIRVISRYMANLGKKHLKVVKDILRYVRGTIDMKLTYGTENTDSEVLEGFNDSAYAENPGS